MLMNRESSVHEELQSTLAQAQEFAREARRLVHKVFASRDRQRPFLRVLDRLQEELQAIAHQDRPVIAVVPLQENLEKHCIRLLLGQESLPATRRFAFEPQGECAATASGAICLQELPPAPIGYEVYLHRPLNETGQLDDPARLADSLLLVIPQSDLRNRMIWDALNSFRHGKATVVVLVQEDQNVEQDVERYRAHWQAAAPEVELSVSWNWMPELFPQKEGTLRDCLQRVLVELVPAGPSGQAGKMEQCVQRAAADLKAELKDIDAKIAKHARELQTLSDQVAQVVRQEVLPPERALSSVVQQQLLTRVVTDTPVGCSPYRDVAGLLALLFGVWTRLWGMATGSLVAWIRGAWQAGKNINQLLKYLSQWSEAAVQRCQQRLQQEFGHLVRNMARILRSEAGSEDDQPLLAAEETQAFEIQGVDRAVQISFQIVQQEIDKVAPPRWLVVGMALATTAVFWFLVSGPILAAYQKYVAANWNFLVHGQAEGWEHLPVFDWKFVFSVILFSVAPVFLGAMITLALAARGGCVRQAVERIQQEHQKLTELIRPYVRAKVGEPRVQAYLDLCRLLEQHAH